MPQTQNPITPQMTPTSMNSSATPIHAHHVTSHPQQSVEHHQHQHQHHHQHQHQHHPYQQSMVAPPAPPHLQIQVSSPSQQRENPMDGLSNMI